MSEGDVSGKRQADTELQAIEFRRLTAECSRGAFRCGVSDLDDFFRDDAWEQHCKLRFQVYTAHFLDDPVPMGFYALTLIQEDIKSVDQVKRHLCYGKNKLFSVMRLGWVAVDKPHQGQGYGEILVGSVIDHFIEVARRTGIFGMTLTAIDRRAAKLYRRMGFEPYGNNELDMMLESRALLDLENI